MGNLVIMPPDGDGTDETLFRDPTTGVIGHLSVTGTAVTFEAVTTFADDDDDDPAPSGVLASVTPTVDIPPDEGDPGHP